MNSIPITAPPPIPASAPLTRRTAPERVPLWRRRAAVLLAACLALPAWSASPTPAAPPMPPLTVVPGAKRLPGKFVWADLVTDNLASAQQFYAELFGWKYLAIHGGYVIALHDEEPLAGILQRPRPKDRPGQPRWFGYISVPKVDRAVQAATKAGGRVIAPSEKVPGRGEQAILADPEGALFGVIRSGSGDPADFLAEPGQWIWVQLMSRDGRAAADFYRKVAGYEIVENTSPDKASDYVLTSGGFARATVRTLPPGAENTIPTWLPFVRVGKIDEAVSRASQLGGRTVIAPRPELLRGRVAVIADPTGATVGLLEWDPAQLKGGR